jgi:thioredoxin reductase (NADPH)
VAGGLSGTELLGCVQRLHPNAKRGLLVDWGAWADARTADAIRLAMVEGRIDYYVLNPWRSPDELSTAPSRNSSMSGRARNCRDRES